MPSKKGYGNKRKKGMSHNKAARKAHGSRLRQGIRRLVNKVKKKKKKK